MKKNNLILLLLTVALAGTAAWLLLRNDGAVLRQERRDFAVADTASITRIFLADRNRHHILLERVSPSVWKVNGDGNANPAIVNQLLETVHRVAVQMRVAKSFYNLVVKDLSTTGIKCEIYTQDTAAPYKTYYVGGSTQDMTGTYMMLEGSAVPFVTEIPGFNGYLTPRYSVNLNDWRDRTVFAADPADIRSVTIDYPGQPGASFEIRRTGDRYEVSAPGGGQPLAADTVAVGNYLSFFRQLPFEDWDKELTAAERDSLRSAPPLAVITVETGTGTTRAVLQHKAVTRRSLSRYDDRGNPLTYDMDRMYAWIREGKELVVIQYYSFGKVLRKRTDFRAAKASAKQVSSS
jgi:hypothetical protein